MFLLKFKHNEKYWFLHSGEGGGFIGSDTYEGARLRSVQNMAKFIGVKGFEITQVADEQALLKMIGGVLPYRIIDFHGGLGAPFCGVEIVNQS